MIQPGRPRVIALLLRRGERDDLHGAVPHRKGRDLRRIWFRGFHRPRGVVRGRDDVGGQRIPVLLVPQSPGERASHVPALHRDGVWRFDPDVRSVQTIEAARGRRDIYRRFVAAFKDRPVAGVAPRAFFQP